MHKHPEYERSPNDEVLSRLRLQNSCYCQSLMRSPWGISMPETSGASYYIFVARGNCVAQLGDEVISLDAGDFLFLPHGSRHELSDSTKTSTVPVDELAWESVLNLCIVQAGGNGPETHLMTGSLVFEVHPLLPTLPKQIQLRATQSKTDAWLRSTVDAMVQEAAAPRIGTEVVLSRFAEVLAVGAIRHWLEAGDTSSPGLLRGLSDQSIRAALNLIHQHPEQRWTLNSLARAVNTSRTDFAARFTELVGVSPMKYWTQWRLSLAAQWLRDEQRTIDEVAEQLGYSSRAAFSRAFKSVMNITPGSIRKTGHSSRLQTMNERLAATA